MPTGIAPDGASTSDQAADLPVEMHATAATPTPAPDQPAPGPSLIRRLADFILPARRQSLVAAAAPAPVSGLDDGAGQVAQTSLNTETATASASSHQMIEHQESVSNKKRKRRRVAKQEETPAPPDTDPKPFAWVDPILLAQAEDGTLPTALFWCLLHPELRALSPARNTAGAMLANGLTTSSIFQSLLSVYTSLELFLVGWQNYLAIICNSSDDLSFVRAATRAFAWHGQFLAEAQLHFRWEGVLKYHIAVANRRNAHGFRPDLWVEAFDVEAFDIHMRPFAHDAHDALPSTPPFFPSAKQRTDYCPAFQAGTCRYQATCPLVHLCAFRDAAHRATDCPKERWYNYTLTLE